MPPQTTRSSVLARLGDVARQAFEAHKADETVYSGGGELPAGIEGGVAQLVEAKIDVYKSGDNEGQPYFYAAGIVVYPETFTDAKGNTARVQGLRTSIMEPLCDTPTRSRPDVESHIAWMLNQLRMLGLPTEGLQFDDLEANLEALKAAAPHFQFRTWKGDPTPEYPNPKTTNSWGGMCAWVGNGDAGAQTEDGTAAAPAAPTASRNGGTKAPASPRPAAPPARPAARPAAPPATTPARPAATPVKPANRLPAAKPAAPAAPTRSGPAKAPVRAPAPAPVPAPVEQPDELGPEPFSEFPDLASLAEAAQGGDNASQIQLSEFAERAGVTAEEIALAADWPALAALTEERMQGATAAAEETSAEWKPLVGDVYNYRPVDGRTKKPADKAVEVEVIATDEANQTVNLKNLSNTKITYKGISWDALEAAG